MSRKWVVRESWCWTYGFEAVVGAGSAGAAASSTAARRAGERWGLTGPLTSGFVDGDGLEP
ncbi:hypothetical protein ACFQZZ_32955 [Nocardia sp. GCM10030253]|uniref:hypothetical protein n=1 Tax=Nocardia sp. GCM10030253 TaxID=3273404 RepID=UPI00363F09A9